MPIFPTFRSLRRCRAAALFAAALVVVACDSGSATAPLPSTGRLVLNVSADSAFEGDTITLAAVARDSSGNVVAGAAVTWSVSDTTRAQLTHGVLTVFRAGDVTVTAKWGALSSSRTLVVRRMAVKTVTIGTGVLQLQGSDVSTVGIHVQGDGERTLLGREVVLSSDDPSIAKFDPSGRVRAVAPGSTTLHATVEGVVGTLRVDVSATNAALNLSRVGEARLPLFVGADTVSWDGVREYHEVYLEQGQLLLKGGSQPRYEVVVRYTEYDVRTVDGRRTMQVRVRTNEYDRGLIAYDARGDLLFTSEYTSPLSHTASPETGGMRMRFRIPGDDQVLDLMFRREPL